MTTAGLQQPPPPAQPDLAGIARAVCGAADQAARRRPGWLYAMVPLDDPLPVAVHRTLLQAALLSALRGVLGCPGARGVLQCEAAGPGVRLRFQGGRPDPDTADLWRRCAREGGGARRSAGAGVHRGSLAAAGRPTATPDARDLLRDRYSLVYQFLGEWSADPGR
ncbi:MAG: hypothetical protein ACLUUL_09875 [Gemmiger sp.]